MRAVLTTLGSNGDVQPLLALAVELRRGGHQPILALSPNFASRARDVGIEFVPTGPELPLEAFRRVMAAQMQNPKPCEQVRHFLEAVLPAIPDIYHSLQQTCQDADVLIGPPHQLACRMVHESMSIPYVSLHLSQFSDLGTRDIREVSTSLINPYREKEGLPPLRDPLGADGGSDELALYAVSRHLLQRPPRWPDYYKVVGFLFLDEGNWCADGNLAAFCAVKPPVVITFGSVVHVGPETVTNLLIDATQKAGCRAIIQHGWSGLARDAMPNNVYSTGYVPHSWLFSRAALVVHHGGAGTSASAFRAGVPAVVIPHTLDQPIWAEFARSKSCARNVIPFSQLNATRLAAAIRGTLASRQIYEAAGVFGEQIRMECGVETARRFIEELLAKRRSETTTTALTAQVQERDGVVRRSMHPVPIGRRSALPLSYAQQRLWVIDQLEPGSATYNMPSAWQLRGNLNRTALQRSLNELVRRHEILRTSFPVQDGSPIQAIAGQLEVQIEDVDLREIEDGEREMEARRRVRQEAETPFDLRRGPLLRIHLLRLEQSKHVLMINMHHIVSDGWSADIMEREIGQLYEVYANDKVEYLTELNIQYADFAVWQREWLQGAVLEEQLGYWRNQLACVPVLELPTDRPRPRQMSHRGASVQFQLSADVVEKLKELSRREEATLFMTLLSGFQVMLSKYSGQEDVAVGTAVANRTHPQTVQLIGLFTNTLVLRTDLSGNPSFREVLKRVRQVALDAYQHQDAPFEMVVHELQVQRDLTRMPLFQVMLVLEGMEQESLELSELSLSELPCPLDTAKFDLTLALRGNEGAISGELLYARDLYDAETVNRMIQHLQLVLKTMVAQPELPIGDLSLVTDSERQQVLVEWNHTESAYPRDKCVHRLFEEQVERSPEAIAVAHENRLLSYGELNRRANRLAHWLRRWGVVPESRIGLCLERSMEMMVGLLGVLKAGAAYVPLDPSTLGERLGLMIHSARPALILTQDKLVHKLAVYNSQLVALDSLSISEHSSANPTPLGSQQNLAYVIYTSGSIGKPKGVAMPHGPLVNLLIWQLRQFKSSACVRTLQCTPLSCDVSFQEIFSTWCSGGTLVLITDDVRSDPERLLTQIAAASVERLFLPPAILHGLADILAAAGSAALPLSELLVAGGQLKLQGGVLSLRAKTENLVLQNQYGPTETHVVTQFSMSGDRPNWPVLPPIGRPIANTRIFLVDRNLQPVPVGVPGELYIGGDALARGYDDQPELTAARFVPDPFGGVKGARMYRTGDMARYLSDGNIEFLGRNHEQVKIRGYRIDVGEIETVLRQHGQVKDALIIARADDVGEQRLVAYVIPRTENAPTGSELSRYLKSKLPNYMLPSAYVELRRIPLTLQGKLDRERLPSPEWRNAELDRGCVARRDNAEELESNTFASPGTLMERAVSEVWKRVLNLPEISVDSKFFEIGGDSLKLVHIFLALNAAYPEKLVVADLFAYSTIAELSAYMEGSTSSRAAVPVMKGYEL